MGLKTKLRGLFASALLALSMVISTQASAITNVLYLAMDGSGSIDNANWNLQVDAYVGALNTVLGGGAFDNNLAIGVSIFGRDVSEIFTITTINGGNLAALTGAINDTRTTGGNIRGGINTGNTATGDAINAAAAAIGAFGLGLNNVIDVSTDGFINFGANDVTAANNAALGGITTNCLGIGTDASACDFATGFSVLSVGFLDFQDALIDKLQTELGVPEPGITALLAMGLLAIGFVRRKRSV